MTGIRALAQWLPANGVLTGSAASLVIKFMSSLLGFVMFALAARQMETAAFGSLAVIFNAMCFLSVVVVCGQETLIARSWGEYCEAGKPGLARGALTFGSLVTVIGGISAALLCASLWLSFGSIESAWVPIGASAFLLAQTLLIFYARFALVAANLILSETPREIPWRLAVIVAIIMYAQLHADFSVADFFFISSVVIGLSLLYQVWRVTRVIPGAVRQAAAEYEIATWTRRSFRMWLSSLLDTSNQYLEVIVVAFILGPVAAAFYFSATRITNVFAMIASGMTTYATTHISKLFHSNSKDELQSMLRSLAIISTLLSAGVFGTILGAGKVLLSFYGPPYVDIYPMLIVLALGASLTGLAGPAPYLLLLTGHERLYPPIMAAAVVLRMGLIAILGHWFGLMGAAVAGGMAAAATAIALVIACRQAVGIDPSVLSAIWRREPINDLRAANPRVGT